MKSHRGGAGHSARQLQPGLHHERERCGRVSTLKQHWRGCRRECAGSAPGAAQRPGVVCLLPAQPRLAQSPGAACTGCLSVGRHWEGPEPMGSPCEVQAPSQPLLIESEQPTQGCGTTLASESLQPFRWSRENSIIYNNGKCPGGNHRRFSLVVQLATRFRCHFDAFQRVAIPSQAKRRLGGFLSVFPTHQPAIWITSPHLRKNMLQP